ncbi:hypothetical protein D3C75_647860 [compost metagenome]
MRDMREEVTSATLALAACYRAPNETLEGEMGWKGKLPANPPCMIKLDATCVAATP